MMVIESLTNSKVKNWVKLSKRSEREEQGLFLVESENLINEAYELGILKEVISTTCTNYDVDSYQVTEDIMKKISTLVNVPRIMGVVEIVNNCTISGNVIMLDRVQDPGNLGTVIRSAVAFGFKSIILGDGCCDVYNDKVIRASEGMIFKVNILRGNLVDYVKVLKDMDYDVLATSVVNGKVVSDVMSDKYAIIFGNEGSGVSEELINISDERIYIPMNKECESLNVGVAASIIMYEMGHI